MRGSAAVKSAANFVGKDVTGTKLGGTPQAPFLSFKYERHPKPLNCASFLSTRDVASDDRHPMYISLQRRFAAFDRSKLHWNVIVPTDLSKKAVVRGWAVRRVKAMFREVLKDQGWDEDGSVAGGGTGIKEGLSGALCIHISKNKAVLEASGEDVKMQCQWLLRKVLAQRDRAGGKRTGKGYVRAWKRSADEVEGG